MNNPKFKTGDAVAWKELVPECTTLYEFLTGFVVNTTDNGCIVGSNEKGKVIWKDNSMLCFQSEVSDESLHRFHRTINLYEGLQFVGKG